MSLPGGHKLQKPVSILKGPEKMKRNHPPTPPPPALFDEHTKREQWGHWSTCWGGGRISATVSLNSNIVLMKRCNPTPESAPLRRPPTPQEKQRCVEWWVLCGRSLQEELKHPALEERCVPWSRACAPPRHPPTQTHNLFSLLIPPF